MHRLATIHFVADRQTDGQTDRQTYDIMMTIADHTARRRQYDQLKIMVRFTYRWNQFLRNCKAVNCLLLIIR